jgi:hypothetical protein
MKNQTKIVAGLNWNYIIFMSSLFIVCSAGASDTDGRLADDNDVYHLYVHRAAAVANIHWVFTKLYIAN